MATLTKSTGTVTLSGAAEKVTLPASYGWVWVKNMSEGDIFAGLSADISEGADGVMTIPAGECGRIQTDGFSSIYLLGTGNALVVAQNYADCPFKVGGKGGEIPDLSAYAKKTDVPNIKVNSAVNADTVGGISPDKISTTPIKQLGLVSSVDNTGNFNLWNISENKVPIFIQLDNQGFYAVPFLYKNQLWLGSTIDEVTRQPVINKTVDCTIYYIEV